MKYTILLLATIIGFCSCETNENLNIKSNPYATNVGNEKSPFSDYWDQGKAEITTYTLSQARYGEVHEGTANTIFVTEPFSKSKQVKLDNASGSGGDNIHVLKLNFTRKFYTGVYPYSTMLSIFTPTDARQYPHSLKAVFGAQEWCGQTYSQLNLTPTGYNMEQYSYFESEGDKTTKLDKVVLEDELWSKIRINPADLPTGKFKAVPGLTFTRLVHQSSEAVMAEGKLTKEGKQQVYSITYPDYGRTLSIVFEAAFPHRISSWSEDGFSGFGANRKKLSTTATLKSRKMLDYWNKHDLKDAPLRQELGIE